MGTPSEMQFFSDKFSVINSLLPTEFCQLIRKVIETQRRRPRPLKLNFENRFESIQEKVGKTNSRHKKRTEIKVDNNISTNQFDSQVDLSVNDTGNINDNNAINYCDFDRGEDDEVSIIISNTTKRRKNINHSSAISSNNENSNNHTLSNNDSINKTKSHNKQFRLNSSTTFVAMSLFLVIFLVNCLLIDMVEGCGPGRGVGRRRAPRKLTPLVYKQHVPNIGENMTPASGPLEGPITAHDKRFKELVPNYNQDIIFRDDEGSGADRLMNLRCKEKLNTLAISVMNQWPGVKLRVIEGWDDTNIHGSHSLHYEGRAVDITTSDKDRSKYGMLARLAVEAGFDWVYYESRAHIHCSVKSDSSQGGRSGGCFSGNSTVMTRHRGNQPISSIIPGDELLSMDSNGQLTYSPVLLFLDRDQHKIRQFLQIVTSSGRRLMITPSHLLYKIPEPLPSDYYQMLARSNELNSEENELQQLQHETLLSLAMITFAKNIEIGDWLLIGGEDGSSINVHVGAGAGESQQQQQQQQLLRLERAVDIQLKLESGVYAPLTTTGNLLVDGIVSSCYAVVDSQSLAHWSFLPIRLYYNFSHSLHQLWKSVNFLISFTSLSFGSSTTESQQPRQQRAFLSMVKTSIKSHERQLQRLNSEKAGIHWYASTLYSLATYILPSSWIY